MQPPVALITAASRGIGAACARELAGRGWRLALMSHGESVNQLAEELDAVAFVGSVTAENDLRAFVQEAMAHYGRIDAVVNSTGHPPSAGVIEATDADWQQTLDLCLFNVVRMARLVTPIMERQGGGAIVNISSINAVEPGEWIVGSVRAALSNYVKLYTRRTGPLGIRMNNLLAGYCENWAVEEGIVDQIPLRRTGRLEEIARAAAFLVSADAGYITGENLRVDGGLTRSA
jgi:NAD(P)-dependent dehydrogenase (short-subunit alcohol dehydrogenase family)